MRNEFIAFMALYLAALTKLSAGINSLLIFTLWLVTGGTQWLRLAYQTLPRTLRLLSRGLKLIYRMLYVKMVDANVVTVFREVHAKYPHRVMFVNAGTGEEWTYSKAS